MDREDLERLFEWDERLDRSSYYEILGLLEIADAEAIRRAFHEFATAFHPDVHPDVDAEAADVLRRVFQRGAEAYRVLSLAESRAEYDWALVKGQLRLADTGERSAPARTSDIRSLDELCRSPSARRHAQRAEQLLSSGDLGAAKRELQMALLEDGDNPDLVDRLDAIDLALYAMGS